jgi:hypothetical protein
VSPSSTPATTTGVPVGGTSITSRSLTTEETDSGSWSGPGGEASWGGGSAVGPDWNKGGLVNKRQYPSKKKRGKGIASAKS